MGTWSVNTTSEEGLLKMTFEGKLTLEQIVAAVEAHNRGVDSFGERGYHVWVDLSRMQPLTQDCAAALEKAKRYSNARRNFRGSAVLVASPTVGMQHRRTSIDGGVIDSEL